MHGGAFLPYSFIIFPFRLVQKLCLRLQKLLCDCDKKLLRFRQKLFKYVDKFLVITCCQEHFTLAAAQPLFIDMERGTDQLDMFIAETAPSNLDHGKGGLT